MLPDPLGEISSGKLPPSLECQGYVRQLQSAGAHGLKEISAVLRFLGLMTGTVDKENFRGNVESFARTSARPQKAKPSAASDMLLLGASKEGCCQDDISKELAALEAKGVTEKELVRDLVFVLQGIDGSIFRFNSKTGRYMFGGVTNGHDIQLSTRHASACQAICRVGGIYRRLLERVNRLLDEDSCEGNQSRTAAAFASQIRDRLMEYYRLTVTLESRIGGPGMSWTLQHLQAWAFQPGKQLRELEKLTEVCLSEKNGGAMVSSIIAVRDSHADLAARWPVVQNGGGCRLRSVLDEVIEYSLQPLVDMTHLWLSEGRIAKNGEVDFFIEESELHACSTSCSDIWSRTFTIDFDKVPSLITDEIALKVFVTGKSINFVRQCCSEGDWLGDHDQPSYNSGGAATTENLGKMVQEAYRRETSLVFNLMINKYRLQDHLLAVKKYLLLSQGDFVGHLMDLLMEHLSMKAQGLRVHTFRDLTDHALRLQRLGSSTGNDDQQEEFDNRLTARLEKPGLSDTGWEVFSLDYVASQPVSVILNEAAMQKYRKVFSISWRLHRAERQLSVAWSQQMVAQRVVLNSVCNKQRRQKGLPSSASNTAVIHLLRTCNALRHEMWHLVQQLRSFFSFNVVGSAWQKLRDSLESLASEDEADLDKVIRLHEDYLSQLMAGHFLDHTDTVSGKKQMRVFDVLNELLSGIYRFTTLQERIYGDLSGGAVVGREDDEKDEVPLIDDATAAELQKAVQERREEFLGNLQRFCAGAMAMRAELKHLVNRIDFNCFYY
ncbi:Gamma-tubulin complex component 3 [Perkinsus chesapeaki]|uniref:Gamma-tubulin complex component 3 n=1 Tax=Perkinsus chesapeaki TaxID=330153 RepID=A0A7J6L6K0_PERCH|nr:Gamma-tubulin complex component 3 [Perkinsus chesapeaki]